MTTLGGWALLRTAGLPIRLWLTAANPDLFARLRDLAALDERYRTAAAAAADQIGAVLVPDPEVDAPTRQLALACRRKLHRGLAVDPGQVARVVAAAAAGGHTSLADQLSGLAAASVRVARQTQLLTEQVDAELDRLLAAPWEALRASPIGRLALLDGTIAAGTDIEARLRRGEPWTGKRLRQRSDYLWRMIARGAGKTTPRGWLGHATLLPLGPSVSTRPPALTGWVAARWTENAHQARLPEQATSRLDDPVRVALAAFHRVEGDELRVWALDPAEPTAVRPLTVRLTPALATVYGALRTGARPVAEVEAAVLPADAGERQRAVLRGFLGELVQLGVCQVSRPAAVCRTGWRPAADRQEPLGRPTDRAGFLDVYRQATMPWPAATGELLEGAVRQLMRLRALMAEDQGPPPLDLRGLGSRPRPVLDVLAERLDAPDPRVQRPGPRSVWPASRCLGSGYARLLEWIGSATEGSTATVDLAPRLTGGSAAPSPAPAWPVDCVVRPLPGGGLVLDGVLPAGVLDARFTAELEALQGPLRQVAAYREFLRHLDAGTGVRSVELLVPPLSERAANAVHRPLYTSAWTGDPDLASYCPTAPADAQHIPLGALAVRLADGQPVIDADGDPVRVLYHATRVAPPPWDALASLLLGGRTPAAGIGRLRHSLNAFPQRRQMPRLTLGGSVVLTPAQWRLHRQDLWDARGSTLSKLRHLVELRARLDLPRWIMISAGLGGRPVPCDLESMHAVPTFEAALATIPPSADGTVAAVVVEEMLPAPDSLTVRDRADRRDDLVAAELVVRLPAGLDPATLAGRAAEVLSLAAAGGPGRLPEAPAA